MARLARSRTSVKRALSTYFKDDTLDSDGEVGKEKQLGK
jgi:hypothetical protein